MGWGDGQTWGRQSRMLILRYKRNSGLGCTPEAALQSTEVSVPVLEGVFLWRKAEARTRVTLSQNLERSPNWRPWVCASQLRGWTIGAQAPNTWVSHGVRDRKATQEWGGRATSIEY